MEDDLFERCEEIQQTNESLETRMQLSGIPQTANTQGKNNFQR